MHTTPSGAEYERQRQADGRASLRLFGRSVTRKRNIVPENTLGYLEKTTKKAAKLPFLL
jgi:hypothetical protein